jgi:hypothetical protein
MVEIVIFQGPANTLHLQKYQVVPKKDITAILQLSEKEQVRDASTGTFPISVPVCHGFYFLFCQPSVWEARKFLCFSL